MEKDTGAKIGELRVDGGASRDAFLMQFQADIMDAASAALRYGKPPPWARLPSRALPGVSGRALRRSSPGGKLTGFSSRP
jgi:hypothetical protein